MTHTCAILSAALLSLAATAAPSIPAAAGDIDGVSRVGNLRMEAAMRAYLAGDAPASSVLPPPEPRHPEGRRFRDPGYRPFGTTAMELIDIRPLDRAVRVLERRAERVRAQARAQTRVHARSAS